MSIRDLPLGDLSRDAFVLNGIAVAVGCVIMWLGMLGSIATATSLGGGIAVAALIALPFTFAAWFHYNS